MPPRRDQLDLAVLADVDERLARLDDRGERRDAGVVEQEEGRRGCGALHPVDDDHVGAGLGREAHVVEDPAGAELHVDGYPVVGRLPDLLDLQAQVVRPDEVGVADGRALVDADRQVAHVRDLVRDLEAEQDAAGAGLRSLADDDLHRVGLLHVVRVVAVVARGDLVDERLRGGPLAVMHAAVARRRRRADERRGPAECLLRVPRQRAEAHPGDADRGREDDGVLGACAEHRRGLAALPVALERDSGEGARDEREVVEARHPPRRRERAHDVAPELRLALDVLDRLERPDVGDALRPVSGRVSPSLPL